MKFDKAYSYVNDLLPEFDFICSRVNIDYDVEYDRDNPDEVQKYTVLSRIMDKLDNIRGQLSYLERPVVSTCELVYNPNSDRYECDYHEFHCGDPIEFLYFDDLERYEWICSRIEHNGDRYYIVGYRNVSLDGLKVRFRQVC